MFARTDIRWPPVVERLFLILSAFNFNLDLIAPECAIKSITFSGKWLFIEGLPLFGWVLLIVIFAVKLFWKACIMRRPRKKLFTHLHVIVATGVVIQRVLYIYLARNTLDIFNCSSARPPDYDADGKVKEYMAYQLSIQCNVPGGTHLFLLPFAAAALIIYVLGLPIVSVYFLWRNKELVKYDQILRAQLTGDDKSTNPHRSFRKTWKALYMNYRPGSWYWEGIVTLRKFFIAFVSLMFRQTPSFQLAMSLLVLFVAYVLQVRTQPYLSHTRASATVKEHTQKVLEGSPLHVKIEDEMRSRAAYYKRSTVTSSGGAAGKGWMKGPVVSISGGASGEIEAFYAARRSRFEAAMLLGRATILRSRIANFLFDYNTAEAVLLASAVLINLAGICFDSSEFSGANPVASTAAYDALAYCVIAIMGLSIIYWFIALFMDVLLVVRPTFVASCLARVSKSSRQVLARGKLAMASATKGKGSVRGSRVGGGVGGGSGGSSSVSADEAASASDPSALATTNNPLMVTSLQSGKSASMLNSASVAGMSQVPDQLTWNVVREAFVAAMERAKESAREVEMLRDALAAAEASSSGGGGQVPRAGQVLRARATFGPVAPSAGASTRMIASLGGSGGAGPTSLSSLRGFASSSRKLRGAATGGAAAKDGDAEGQ